MVTVVGGNDKRAISSQGAACREASAAKKAAAANAKRTVRRMVDPTIGSFLVGAVDYRGGGGSADGINPAKRRCGILPRVWDKSGTLRMSDSLSVHHQLFKYGGG